MVGAAQMLQARIDMVPAATQTRGQGWLSLFASVFAETGPECLETGSRAGARRQAAGEVLALVAFGRDRHAPRWIAPGKERAFLFRQRLARSDTHEQQVGLLGLLAA